MTIYLLMMSGGCYEDAWEGQCGLAFTSYERVRKLADYLNERQQRVCDQLPLHRQYSFDEHERTWYDVESATLHEN